VNHKQRTLADHPLLWRATQLEHHVATLPSGHAALDTVLPGHGWPQGAVTELLHPAAGFGEFSLLLPVLAQLSQQQYRITLIDPPWVPYPPALHGRGLQLDRLLWVRTKSREESLWACEQVLRGIPGGAMLAWPDKIAFSELRRMQLAAENGQKMVFLFRPAQTANESSPAALRLQLDSHDGDLQIKVLKCRGQRARQPVYLRRSQLLQPSMPQPFKPQPSGLQPLIPPLVSSRGSSKRVNSSSERPVVSKATSRIERPSL